MTAPKWILPGTVIAVHRMLLAEHGGRSGIRDRALLDSALNRARQRFEYTDDSSVFDLAASYCHGLARNHPFMDGNKRIALTTAAIFLEINGFSLDAPEPETVLVIQGVAAGDVGEEELSRWLHEHSVPHA